jgi:hypothetical protein
VVPENPIRCHSAANKRAQNGIVVERGQDVRRRDASSTIESEPCPEEPIRGGQLGSLYRPMEDAELVTKRQDLKLKGRAAAERPRKGREER